MGLPFIQRETRNSKSETLVSTKSTKKRGFVVLTPPNFLTS